MRHFKTIVLSATLMLAGAALAAEDAAPHKDRMPQPLTRDALIAKVKEGFAKADLNRDGYLTLEEMLAAKKADHQARREKMRAMMFERLDTNHDGMISREEFLAKHERPAGEGWGREHDGFRAHIGMRMIHRALTREMLEHADTNHDGRYSLDEVMAFYLAKFDAADTNHDGVLTPEEMRSAISAGIEKVRKSNS